jgi:hypothetical protein
MTGEAPGNDPALEVLAREEQILTQDTVDRGTLLAAYAYLRRHPEHAEALIAFATELSMNGKVRAREDAETGSSGRLSVGEPRAHEAICGREAELRVVEERTEYVGDEQGEAKEH